MTGSNQNKILTVSYGTFSCTLEGFDDPFGTMRGIAEYFRDLAADDRYFGAEPPTPDVEMLQNIAQKEVQRRVEARVGDAGVALRQMDGADKAGEPVAPRPDPTDDVEDAETLESGPLTFDDDYLMADEPEDVLTVEPDAVADQVDDDAPVETVAEKLRRIRAVVSRSIEPAEDDASFSAAPGQDADAGAEAPQKRNRALSETIASITADLADDDDVDALSANATNDDADTVDDLTADVDDDEPGNDDTSDELIANLVADEQPDDIEDDGAEEVADFAAEDAAPLDDVEEMAEAADEPVEADEGHAAIAAAEQGEDVADADDFAAPDDIEDVDVLALSDDSDANLEDDEPEDVFASDDAPAPDADADEDDNLLDAVMAAAQEETPEDDVEDDEEGADVLVLEDAEPEVEEQRPTSKPLAPISEQNGDVGRLLEETDNKLAEDDSIRRRRVISQMRAAVAATKADRIFSKIITREEQDEAEQSAYRADLNRVISRQPTDADLNQIEAEMDEEETPEPTRPAPLVLVSSQRVDMDRVPADVRPHRVEKSERVESESPETSDFKAFAQQMGASELPDLLEAAAAYSAFIEGQPHFSRPDIMKRVARVDPALQMSREAGLRSFGQLLRQGKIQKLQRGQFTIPESTRFNPAQRIAGE